MHLLQAEGEEEETDELVGQVLDEIGITLNGELVGVPGKEAQAAKQVGAPRFLGGGFRMHSV